ncbi:MAG: hypothetical protein HFJ75_04560 [Eggerthellaceae bacterium]|nr:hypothetical protein [Eggerthellaceae bacterium]
MESRIIAFEEMGKGAAAHRGPLGPAARAAARPAGEPAPSRGAAVGAAPAPRAVCLVEDSAVAGTRHVPGVRDLADGLRAGDALAFRRDGRNPYDPWATEVRDAYGNRLGYVSCEHNEVVGRLMDGGLDVGGVVSSVEQVGGWTRIGMEVRLYA